MTSEKARLQAALQSIQEMERAVWTPLSSLDSAPYKSWKPMLTSDVEKTLDQLQALNDALEPLHTMVTDDDAVAQLPPSLCGARIVLVKLDIVYLHILIEHACLDLVAYKQYAQSVSPERVRERIDARKRIEKIQVQSAKVLKKSEEWRKNAMEHYSATQGIKPRLTIVKGSGTASSKETRQSLTKPQAQVGKKEQQDFSGFYVENPSIQKRRANVENTTKREESDMNTQQQQGVSFTLHVGEHEVHIALPTLIEPEDSLSRSYGDTAIPFHLYIIACPSFCGRYAVLTPEGTHCAQCGQREFPYLATCDSCGKLADKMGSDGEYCYACGQFGGNSDGLLVWGNKKTGDYYERNTIAEAREGYYEDHFSDNDALFSE